MHVNIITPKQMADIWCAFAEGDHQYEVLGAEHIIRGTHPILGAVAIADDAERAPGCGYVLLSELPISVLASDQHTIAT